MEVCTVDEVAPYTFDDEVSPYAELESEFIDTGEEEGVAREASIEE